MSFSDAVTSYAPLDQIKVSFQIRSDAKYEEDDYMDFLDARVEPYVKGIQATITGRDIDSGKRKVIGYMKAADLLQVNKALENGWFCSDVMRGHSESHSMLHGEGKCDGDDILSIDTLRLERQYRGNGIGLLAVGEPIKRVEEASRTFYD